MSFFGPLKKAYYSECDKYMRYNMGERICTSEISELFNNAFSRAATLEKPINGFKTTGIFPMNRDISFGKCRSNKRESR